jgi:hypothetical protein
MSKVPMSQTTQKPIERIMELNFVKAEKLKDLRRIHEYTIDAFSDTPDFSWTLDEIKQEVKDGWELFGVTNEEDEIVAAIFFCQDKDTLLTKNTGLRIHHQGSGYSHQIKDYFEKVAKQKRLKKIAHFCRIDNFRMYSLNESHGYQKSGKRIGPDGQVVEWIKVLK